MLQQLQARLEPVDFSLDELEIDCEVNNNMPENMTDEEKANPFDNLDLNEWYCFGIEHPKKSSWAYICMKSRTLGWKAIDVKKLENSLRQNVDASYICLASFYLTNLDDDMKYLCFFDNQKCMWGLQVQDSPKAEISIEDKAAFFKSDMFKKIAQRTADIVLRANDEYEQVIDQHLKNGELLEVDEVKLSAILHLIGQTLTISNLRNGKWMK